MNNELELPSLEEIEAMEKQQSQAFEALEISDSSVKCQRCGNAVPLLVPMKTRSKNDRIAFLQRQLNRIENYYSHIGRTSYDNEVTQIKQELAELLEAEAKADTLRRLPLHSSKISGWRYVCGTCFDRLYARRRK